MIRTFQPGDLLLLQRLQRQATKVNAVQSLLAPQSAVWMAASSAFAPLMPWSSNSVTYVLRPETHQIGHGLERAGFLQAQRRSGRPEEELVLLAPALETRTGHPAIWLKLLSHYINETIALNAANPSTGVQRIYADVPDQPLLVQTLGQVGFSIYARQTIWRMTDWEQSLAWFRNGGPPRGGAALKTSHAGNGFHARSAEMQVRTATRDDEWSLRRLYSQATPRKVQAAEGTGPQNALLQEQPVKPPILEWWHSGEVHTLVLEEGVELRGCLRVVIGKQGVWLQLWADTPRMDSSISADLIAHGLRIVYARASRLPVYTAVRDYQGGLGPTLADFGFAPVMDHAKMVKQMVQRAIEAESLRPAPVEAMGGAIVTFRPHRHHRLTHMRRELP